MNERPILFSSSMVLALLAGTKTQTRRIVKGTVEDVRNPEWYGERRLVHSLRCQRPFCETVDDYALACGGYDCEADGRTDRSPYGSSGDRLWVKETHAIVPRTAYWHDLSIPHVEREHEWAIYRANWERTAPSRWRPSIHMPRWASRLTLEITGVRVERLQGITQADARAEGVVDTSGAWEIDGPLTDSDRAGPRGAYEALWESINGEGSWDANPWVWKITFKRVTP